MSGALKVWSKFSAKKGGNVINLRIVDAPENLFEEVINLYMTYTAKEESTYKAAGLPKSAEAIEELRALMLASTKEKGFHAVICCLDNDDDQIKDIFGASMMTLTSKGDPEPEYQFKSEEMKRLLEIYYGLATYYDETKELNLDRFFSDRGLFVRPEYRELGIEQELFKVRREICKEHGISINGAWMTSADLQKAAERDGWETVSEVQLEELGKKLGVTFEGDSRSFKFMIAKIQ